MFRSAFSLAAILMIFLVSCTSQQFFGDPKGRLTEYISKSFSVKSLEDKEKLMGFLTGDVRSRLESWSEDQFRDAFIESKREFIKLQFKEVKAISPSEVQMTYELSYFEKGKASTPKKHDAKVTSKKLCQMVMKEGRWYISDVRNIKELIEYQDEFSVF